MATVGLDGQGVAGVFEEGVSSGFGAGEGLLSSVQLMGGEFVVEEIAAEIFEKGFEVDLRAVVFFAGLGEEFGPVGGGEAKMRADRRTRNFHRVGGVEIFDPDGVVGLGAGKEDESVEMLAGETLEKIPGKIGVRLCDGGLEAGEGFVLGLEEPQRVTQDCLAVLGAPNRQGGFCETAPIHLGFVGERAWGHGF